MLQYSFTTLIAFVCLFQAADAQQAAPPIPQMPSVQIGASKAGITLLDIPFGVAPEDVLAKLLTSFRSTDIQKKNRHFRISNAYNGGDSALYISTISAGRRAIEGQKVVEEDAFFNFGSPLVNNQMFSMGRNISYAKSPHMYWPDQNEVVASLKEKFGEPAKTEYSEGAYGRGIFLYWAYVGDKSVNLSPKEYSDAFGYGGLPNVISETGTQKCLSLAPKFDAAVSASVPFNSQTNKASHIFINATHFKVCAEAEKRAASFVAAELEKQKSAQQQQFNSNASRPPKF